MKWYKKKRKYPIKRDEQGKSARKRAFESFDKGLKPKEIGELCDISIATTRKYYADWKKLPERFGLIYQIGRISIKAGTKEINKQLLADFAGYLDISTEQLMQYLESPWGLHQLISGKLRKKLKAGERDKGLQRLLAVCKIVYLQETREISPKQIVEALEKLDKPAYNNNNHY